MNAMIGTFEAKTHFSTLIDRVAHGEEIIITRRGEPVARISPICEEATNKARDAATRLRQLRSTLKNAGTLAEWQAYRLEGRR